MANGQFPMEQTGWLPSPPHGNVANHFPFFIPRLRWRILRTLLYKEMLRHLANRGGITLAALLVVASLLLSFAGKGHAQVGSLAGGIQRCFVDYWEDGPWIDHLYQHLPSTWRQQVLFRPVGATTTLDGDLVYPPGTGAIQIRPNGRDEQGPRYQVCFWYPGADGGAIAPFEAWFWKETNRFFRQQTAATLEHIGPPTRTAAQLPTITEERQQLRGGLDGRSAVTTALVLFSLFFVCVYLLPSLTCEERERGVLLAQALSPASPLEILMAKFFFYPLLGVGLAALLAGINNPAALARPFLWLALGVAALGALGIGLTIASLARTQRTASMGALCYMLVVALLLYICQQTHLAGVSYLFLEYYCPRILHAALEGAVMGYHWANLAGAAVLAMGWTVLAAVLFRRCGWQ